MECIYAVTDCTLSCVYVRLFDHEFILACTEQQSLHVLP